MHLETTVEIDAPREKVWETLTDVDRWPEWTASMTEVERIGGGVLAPGTNVRIRQPRMPTLIWEVTELVPGASFTWQSASAGVTTVASHALSTSASDGVVVTLAVQQSGALAALLGLVMSRRARRYVQMEALGLKQRCESTGS